MKVKDVIEELKKCDPESECMLQEDSEGNGYEELRGIDNNSVRHDDDIYNLDYSAEDHCLEDEEWEEIKKRKPCLVFYP